VDVLSYYMGDAGSLNSWVIICYGWAGDRAFSYPDLEAASGGNNVFFEEALTNELF